MKQPSSSASPRRIEILSDVRNWAEEASIWVLSGKLVLANADVCTPLRVMVGLVRHETAVGAGTVIAELPLLPSEVALIVADPAPSPVTSPLPFTVATAGAPLAHVTTPPESGFPVASFVVAARCTGPPTP